MFVCKDCGRIFEEPREYTETHGLDSPPYEHWRGCPLCGGTYTEAIRCDGCGEYIVGEYIKTIDYRYYCENCFKTRDTDND